MEQYTSRDCSRRMAGCLVAMWEDMGRRLCCLPECQVRGEMMALRGRGWTQVCSAVWNGERIMKIYRSA